MSLKSKRPYIIGITGTKGKTSVARLLQHVYLNEKKTTLLVDTDGHYLNGKQLSTLKESMELYGLVPTIGGGRYLRELAGQANTIAIMESAVGAVKYGLGYRLHDVAVFTNVYEDHIGFRIKDRAQLAREKGTYIFGQLAADGTAVFNADDKLVTEQLLKHQPIMKFSVLPVGLDFTHFDLDQHLADGGQAVTIQDGQVGIKNQTGFKGLLAVNEIYWTFDGHYRPSLYNLMFAIAALYAELGLNQLPDRMIQSIKDYQLDESGGRLTLFENKQTGVKVLADFAHEKYSLIEIANLARQLSTNQVTGVIRFAPERSDELLRDTGSAIANQFDNIIVYDKIDGVERKQYKNRQSGLERTVGEISGVVVKAIEHAQQPGHTVRQIIKEKEAIAHAISHASAGDCIVHIVGSDHQRSINYIKQHLLDQ